MVSLRHSFCPVSTQLFFFFISSPSQWRCPDLEFWLISSCLHWCSPASFHIPKTYLSVSLETVNFIAAVYVKDCLYVPYDWQVTSSGCPHILPKVSWGRLNEDKRHWRGMDESGMIPTHYHKSMSICVWNRCLIMSKIEAAYVSIVVWNTWMAKMSLPTPNMNYTRLK